MTWSKSGGKGSDGPYSPSWQVWRGSWQQAPWKQQQSQQQGGKGKEKGQSKGTSKGKTVSSFPAYDMASPVVDVVQEIPKRNADNYISELQRAINNARKLESQIRKLDVQRQEKARQWRKWQEDLKQSFATEKSRYNKDMAKIEQDALQATEELCRARANLRHAAAGDTQMEPIEAGVAEHFEEDFAALLEGGARHSEEEVCTEEANMEVLRRAMEAAARPLSSPSSVDLQAVTPARRTSAPAMAPYRGSAGQAAGVTNTGGSGNYTASPGLPAATDPYLASPMVPTPPSMTAAMRSKDRARTGIKEVARPKQPVHPGQARSSPSLADKLEARRNVHRQSDPEQMGNLDATVVNEDGRTTQDREQADRLRLNIPAQVPVMLLDDDNDSDLAEPGLPMPPEPPDSNQMD